MCSSDLENGCDAGDEQAAVEFAQILRRTFNPKDGAHPALRKVVAAGALGEFPLVCLSAALSYFDSYRMAQGTANLIQGQRDFFGAHGFELIDRPGEQHGKWPSTIGK